MVPHMWVSKAAPLLTAKHTAQAATRRLPAASGAGASAPITKPAMRPPRPRRLPAAGQAACLLWIRGLPRPSGPCSPERVPVQSACPWAGAHLQGGRPEARKPRVPMKRAYCPPKV